MQLGVWKKNETAEQLMQTLCLDAFDTAEYAKIANDRRRTEWLATRIVMNKMLDKYAEIRHIESGKPYLQNDRRFVSISHSPDMVAVMLSENNLGIDIEQIRPRTTKVRTKFLTGSELDWCKTDEEHTFVWTIKEAAYKLIDNNLSHTEVEIIGKPDIGNNFSCEVLLRKNGLRKMICHTIRLDDNFLSYLAEQ